MQTIIIVLNPKKLENADLDLRYRIPERIEKASKGTIQDNGYDYINAEDENDAPLLGIWLKTETASESWPIITKLFQKEKFMKNDLFLSSQIYIFKNDSDELSNCTLVFPA